MQGATVIALAIQSILNTLMLTVSIVTFHCFLSGSILTSRAGGSCGWRGLFLRIRVD